MDGGSTGGLITSSGDASTGLTLSFTRDPGSIGAATLEFQWDTDLDGTWSDTITKQDTLTEPPAQRCAGGFVFPDCGDLSPPGGEACLAGGGSGSELRGPSQDRRPGPKRAGLPAPRAV